MTGWHKETVVERFFAKVQKTDDCWIWTGGSTTSGYGCFKAERLIMAHRWSYAHHVGPIPDGLTIDHLCRNTPCVNPDHLEAVTQAENNRRRHIPTTCPQGHEFTPENTGRRPNGHRKCLACDRDRARAKRAARKGVAA